MNFFKWYGGLSRKMLVRFQHLFVQNESSLQLLKQIGLHQNSSVAGDTRFDRVITIAEQAQPIEGIEAFKSDQPLLVAGSTWPEDERAIQEALADPQLRSLKLIVAPHEISTQHIAQLKELFPSAVCYSTWEKERTTSRVLIMDNYGMLSRLYRYATVAYIGGGLHRPGIHNTLEAAVYCIPVLFGPQHKKHAEAVALIKAGGAFSFGSAEHPSDLKTILSDLLHQPAQCKEAGRKSGEFVKQQGGATHKIIHYIQENRLLTN
jgi:3-deoxy-D-manno-octulosonic-acid transferase